MLSWHIIYTLSLILIILCKVDIIPILQMREMSLRGFQAQIANKWQSCNRNQSLMQKTMFPFQTMLLFHVEMGVWWRPTLVIFLFPCAQPYLPVFLHEAQGKHTSDLYIKMLSALLMPTEYIIKFITEPYRNNLENRTFPDRWGSNPNFASY